MKIILSASRRTDIPAFYMDWFMDRIGAGFFETVNPYNQKKTIVPATPDHAHTIVFWSKNFSRFLSEDYGEALRANGYHLFFQFTVNTEIPFLEPRLPPLAQRLEQAAALCRNFGPDTVSWRFDPICFYTTENGEIGNNLSDFSKIAEKMAAAGVTRCITSFMDHYGKIKRRPVPYDGFRFVDPDRDQKIQVLERLAKITASFDMELHVCCEKETLSTLPQAIGVKAGSCISGHRIKEIFGGSVSLKKDTGQRIKQGCGCTVSTDIGIYNRHPCYHNCLFCYANPKPA
jgi:hypothetical protein